MRNSFLFKNTVIPAQCPGPVQNRQVPRAPLPASGVTLSGRVCALSPAALPAGRRYYGPIRQSAPLPPPRFVSLVQRVLAGCCQPLLENGPSRRYLRNPCQVAWTLTPWCSFGAHPFLPKGQRPRHRDNQLGTPNDLCKATSTEGYLSGLQSFTHVQAPQLARPPGCTHRKTSMCLGRPGRLRHAKPLTVACQSSGIATCLNRVTGTAGLAPAGLRPCRLLMTPFLSFCQGLP